MVLFTHQFESEKAVDERICDYLDSFEERIRTKCPTLHKLMFKCDPQDLIPLRRVLSFLMGLLVGTGIHWLIGLSPIALGQKKGELVVMGFALIFMMSVQCRCIFLLIIPTLLVDMGKALFYVQLFREIVNGILIKKFIEIIRSLAHMLGCLASFRFSMMLWQMRVWVGSFADSLIALTKGQRPDQRTFLGKIAKDLSKNRGKISDALVEISAKVGNPDQDQTAKPCAQLIDKILEGCKAEVKNIFGNFFGGIFGDIGCRCIFEDRVNLACDDMKKMIANKKADVHHDTNALLPDLASKSEHCNIEENDWCFTTKVEHKLDDLVQWDTFEDMQREGLLPDIESYIATLESLGLISDILLLFIFFRGLWIAINYHRQYHKSLQFENNYVDRYFRHVDKRRRRKGPEKVTLLPLRGMDRHELIMMYSPWWTAEECTTTFLSLTHLLVLVIFGGLLLYVDIFLTSFVNHISDQLNVVFRVQIYSHNHPKFENNEGGQNLFTSILGQFTLAFDYNGRMDYWQYDLNECKHPVAPITSAEYWNMAAKILYLFLLIFVTVYVKRSRRLICDYFYHRYSKERTLALYNQYLFMRKEYLSERIAELRRMIKERRVFERDFDYCNTFGAKRFSSRMPYFQRQILGLYDWCSTKCCFVCMRPIDRPYIVCEGKDPNKGGKCNLLYHEVCFEDMGDACLNCGKRDNRQGRVLVRNPFLWGICPCFGL